MWHKLSTVKVWKTRDIKRKKHNFHSNVVETWKSWDIKATRRMFARNKKRDKCAQKY